LLVRREAVVGAGLDENGASLTDSHLLALDLQRAGALEHDVELVVLVRLLTIRLGRDQDVDADLETGGVVDDLVPSTGLVEPLLDRGDLE
jgi:hypothetical protein